MGGGEGGFAVVFFVVGRLGGLVVEAAGVFGSS